MFHDAKLEQDQQQLGYFFPPSTVVLLMMTMQSRLFQSNTRKSTRANKTKISIYSEIGKEGGRCGEDEQGNPKEKIR